MHSLALPKDVSPLEFRAQQLLQHGRYAYDLLLSHWRCLQCGSAVPGAEPMGLPLIVYRSVEDLGQQLARAGQSAYEHGELPACPDCGRLAALHSLEHHAYVADESRDLVFRWKPDSNKPLSLWFWSRDHGYVPIVALNHEQRFGFARDALLRAVAAHRDFDEFDEAEQVLEEAILSIPGEPELLRFMPWLTQRRRYELAGAIAQIHFDSHPEDPRGCFWLGQVQLELIAANALARDNLTAVAELFEEAIALSADGAYPDAELGLVNVERLLAQPDRALCRVDELLRRHPNHPEALYTKGLLLLAERPAQALECFEQGATLRPDDPDYLRGIERARLAIRQKRGAE